MDSKLLIIISCLLVLVDGCKVHPKNSEPSVRVFFLPTKVDSKKDFCLDDVKDNKGKSWSKCLDSLNNYLDIPLDLNENSKSIIFVKNKKADTLDLKYQVKVEYKDGEFDSKISEFKITKTSFDSITTSHRPSKIINTNVTESISIYY